MFFPIGTSVRPRRTPYANYALIFLNFLIFFLSYHSPTKVNPEVLRPWAEQFMLNPARPYIWQFVTYAFLHGSYVHIFGNMLFLYVFGRNVNDKLGNLGYVCFYLAGAVFSAIGHIVLGGGPVLGASGAIAAVTGAYLALYAASMINIFYWLFIIIDTVEIPAIYLIVLKLIVWDNIVSRTAQNVAYDAHLSGYAFGIITMFVMLGTKLLEGDLSDLPSIVKQWNRRRQYRDAVASGYDPYTPIGAKIKSGEQTNEPVNSEVEKLKIEIAQLIAQRNVPDAAQKYLELIQIDREQVLPRQHLLDIANQLASENKHAEAAAAYEKFTSHYSSYEYIEQVQLMAGILYSRYLNQPDAAIKHLEAAMDKLSDPGQLKMCRDELEKLRG
ncbi:MAG: rhomboid family intramembrane serine protease [Phycisphaerae bacterium]|jgi:membrane associated rhomboid family serine protease